jgi:branched-chain amino acid transport system permease protein
VSPEDSSIYSQFQGVIFCSIGGMGTLMGPIVGTVILNIIPEFLHALKEFRLIFFAVVLLGFVLFIPNGIVGTFNKYAANRKRKQQHANT